MDFGGVLGVEMLVGSSSCSFSSSPMASSDLESVRKMGLFGSHFLKQGRPGRAEEDDRRCTKIARSIQQSRSSNGEQMLSFSSAKPSPITLSALPSSSSAASSHARTAALSHGDLNVSMQGVVGGKNVPFTLPQRMELEQQMLIYNYIRANVPIPANLLSSLRRGLNTSGLSGSYRPNAAWWGYFHPGFAGNADPEPGRCRRTDGKKWRCSRDAVPDQKYCERHINRGRHRSRKPVEGQGGHAKKPMQIISNPTSASAVSSGGQSSNELTVGGKLIQNPQPTADTPPSQLWILAGGKAVNDHGEKAAVPLIVSSTPKPFNSLFSTSKSCSPLELDSGDCLLSQLGGAFAATNNNTNFSSPLELHDWPSSLSDCSTITWPGAAEEMQPERSQLSLPFPMTSSDFSSSSSSPTAEKLSPLHMGLGIRGFTNELNRFQMSWRSSPWEAPARASAAMAGPLGEALASTGAAGMDENKIFLSLMNESWDLSPQLASSTRTHMQHTALSSASSASGNDLAAAEKNTTQEGFSCFFGTKNPNSSSFPL